MTDKLLTINDLLLECAAGHYQWALLSGQQCWSGGDLVGEANKWGARYHESRRHLLARVQAAAVRRGWQALLGYVLAGEPRRWRLRLILVDEDGRHYDQANGRRLERVERPEGSSVAPGFELREAA